MAKNAADNLVSCVIPQTFKLHNSDLLLFKNCAEDKVCM
ncbi:hypothetical protein C427_1526 [Paraglaciecola psychrophila 170]|uniref:Uncharacterized protein n=1 Tax=Paraglaciecola psychrophila 170 TaxID=1129794 RepID=K7AX89_9ALTE|nr:hypothetical protein C427_1526 [Paraglaciecola psychrophila 170]GAC39740.1 hypothetical protein GPSY_4129 [Paraglaciecola psychrophila 170]